MDALTSGRVSGNIGAPSVADDVSWQTTQATLTEEEEDAIVTLVVIVIGVVAAIIILFSMGIFIDCRHQKKDGMKKKKLKLKMPAISRRRNLDEDRKSLASDMCPSASSDLGSALPAIHVIV